MPSLTAPTILSWGQALSSKKPSCRSARGRLAGHFQAAAVGAQVHSFLPPARGHMDAFGNGFDGELLPLHSRGLGGSQEPPG